MESDGRPHNKGPPNRLCAIRVTCIGYDSTIRRVLDIPEIIELIFSFLEKRNNVVNACVCKRWSEIALDAVWRDVDNLNVLFSLLAPLGQASRYAPVTFTRTLNPDDWRRFAHYARRVRKLSYTEDRSEQGLCSSIFDEIARSRMAISILPNLHTLEWRTMRLRHALPFMGESVRDFRVELHDCAAHPLSTFLEDVAERMPHLTSLDLSFGFPVRDLEDGLTTLLKQLTKLTRIIMPLYTISSRIVESVSMLPALTCLQFEYEERQGQGEKRDVQEFAPRLQEGAFPALYDLNLSVNLPDMTRFLNSKFSPANLTSLYVHVLSSVVPDVLTEFLLAVSESCKLLTALYVDLYATPDALDSIERLEAKRLAWEHLRPLLSFRTLKTFELRWDLPLRITEVDIAELASGWPTLEVLMLNCEPLIPLGVSSLTLSTLVYFAEHCPNLRELGLYITGNVECLPAPVPFRKLSKLCVGVSSIGAAAPAALFLSKVLPPGCDVIPGVSWPDSLGMLEVEGNSEMLGLMQRRATEWYNQWAEVSRMLPLLTRLRAEERARQEGLQREVEDLRVRCKVLEDRAALPDTEDGRCVIA
ncbi:uncharacterized protein LAESUDRAFT_655083 [Laetiporus sulphureus 93-53]|uniref:F-box domain-containing protein n=1 Tax=Laetiporus sulphureus 93-53 TaxID=1314785 RepID=A0A165DVG8_9APHY|nr:uncharacterized protein LAESUDRAFT_655083 [Laetiporus sulphureus 93-53]KZT05707.1 hypothetical protein LAESUDRAFT_655083 [Laetiporus sulphureus 93-53]